LFRTLPNIRLAGKQLKCHIYDKFITVYIQSLSKARQGKQKCKKFRHQQWGQTPFLAATNVAKFHLVIIIGSYPLTLRKTHMDTARIFQSGRSQAVRLPKEYRFDATEVAVRHFGNGVLLLPIDNPWTTLEAALMAFEPGFELTRELPEAETRPAIAV
jgi:antitoxin VapB